MSVHLTREPRSFPRGANRPLENAWGTQWLYLAQEKRRLVRSGTTLRKLTPR